jgi:hypothetical protein
MTFPQDAEVFGCTLNAPAGFTLSSTTLPFGASSANQILFTYQTIGDPQSTCGDPCNISDQLFYNFQVDWVALRPRFSNPPLVGNTFDLLFASDGPSGLGVCYAQNPVLVQRFPACDIYEDGTVQTIGTITWTDGNTDFTDTVKFQSGTAVPEPSSLALLLTGVIAAAGSGIRRHKGL